jgi:hypothetical protein
MRGIIARMQGIVRRVEVLDGVTKITISPLGEEIKYDNFIFHDELDMNLVGHIVDFREIINFRERSGYYGRNKILDVGGGEVIHLTSMS